MLYYLFQYLNQLYDIPGFGVFKFLTFRAILAVVFSLIISLLIGGKIIDFLRNRQIGEMIRNDGPETHKKKAGTPTMGGAIIIAAIVIPTLLWADIKNAYVWLILLGTVWMGAIGFLDDYIKVFKKDKQGLKGRFKIVGQVGLGIIVAVTMLFHPDFMGGRANLTQLNNIRITSQLQNAGFVNGDKLVKVNEFPYKTAPEGTQYKYISNYEVERRIKIDGQVIAKPVKISIAENQRFAVAREIFGPKDKDFVYRTNFPFVKSYVFDYSNVWGLTQYFSRELLGRIVFFIVALFIVTAVSNAVNITDGIDGLAAGTTAIVGTTLGVFAYISGNAVFANYLNISYIPLSSELIVYASALVGACIGFLWYNTYPAQVFMGDTGSLALGGALGVMALMVKKELLLPILCGVFFAETLSVILQVSYFKYLKRKHGLEYAQQNRLLLMSPLHHHFEKKGMHESKIVTRFWIVAILMSVLAFATLKLR